MPTESATRAEHGTATAAAGERFTVLVADHLSPSGLQPLADDERFVVELGHDWEEARFRAALETAHALVVRSSTTVDAALLDRAPGLRVIGRAGVGVDNIDLDAATERGIPVLNAPSGNTVSAAELTLALILALARKVPEADRSVRAGEWRRSAFAGAELRGKTLGLVGAGRIGGEVARRAQAFGMLVLAHDPYLSEERAEELGLEPASLEKLLERADVVSLHVPLTSSTRGMIGPDELARMKASALLVNLARGGVVDEHALARALCDGTIAGAALDVYESEPLEEGIPLRDAPNTVLTPHLGAATAEAQELVATEIAAAVRGALLEGDLSRALNAPAIGGETLRRLRPILDLGGKLGRLACVLSSGGIDGVEIRYAGSEADGLKPLSAAVLSGLLSVALGDEQVNFVNALHLARERGIDVSTSRLSRRKDYSEFLQVELETGSGPLEVSGALLGDRHPRIVRIGEYHVDVVPQGSLVVLKNRDVPGVIGRVGTLLGSHGL
ncbi:MAG: phosphoglycerate dehydrogenase, partial [Gemmatimonadetes bacterium]|nr:phosphoglycerate dehydrogenase [Gemmatimonadota bacterium]NIR80668.1 phosphoglycerate dehydrogenase [Gemmatimonadota bacterium]NIT89459.1 phosphoglycerate dehydrogenase [Gemmatimonadota bacterium]NIU33262.1 phosphoglycerate dehydrogenase [Gemmatimonadota bacterium]NIU37567.1 phosphoglycerate dehydrogenase [Gemmatimonadota bacterium]